MSSKPRFVGEKNSGATVKDLCTVDNGFAFDSKLFNSDGNGMPIIRIRDIKPGVTNTYTTEACDSRYLVNDGDMLIGMDGEFNLTKWQSGMALLNQRVCRIRSNSTQLLDDYLRYFLPVALKHIEARTACVTVKHLSSKVLNAVEISLKPLEEQRAIVLRLDNIQRQIDIARSQLSQLDQLVKSRFVEMFGDPNDTNLLWDEVFVSAVANVTVGVVVKPAQYYSETGVKAFRSLNIAPMRIKDDDWVYFSEEGNSKNVKSQLETGDVVIVRSGSPGTACVVPGEYAGSNAVDIIIAKLNQSLVDPIFFAMFMNMPHGQRQIVEGTGGSAQQHFNVGRCKKMKLPLPPLDLQEEFAAFAAQADKSRFS